MSAKYSARELAFHYVARLTDALSEEEYLKKIVEVEATFAELLASAKPPAKKKSSDVWKRLAK